MALSSSRRALLLTCILLSVTGVALVTARLSARRTALSQTLDQGFQATQKGEFDQAEKHWHEALTLSPEHPLALRSLAETLRLQAKWPEAIQTYQTLARVAPDEPHVYCQLAELSLRQNDDTAIESAAQKEPSCLRAQLLAAQRARQQGDTKKALSFLETAHRHHSDAPLLAALYAQELQQASQQKEALQVARTLAERFPGYAYTQAFYGLFASRLSDPAAQSTLEKAVRLDPTSGVAQAALGFHYNGQNDPRRAIPHLQSALLLRFDQPDLLFQLARAWRATGRTADANRLQKAFDRLSALQSQLDGLGKRQASPEEQAPLQQQLTEAQAIYGQERARLGGTP